MISFCAFTHMYKRNAGWKARTRLLSIGPFDVSIIAGQAWLSTQSLRADILVSTLCLLPFVSIMSWLAGYVKEVQSGDTVVITSNRSLNGTLAEKRLNLASLSSPRMVCFALACSCIPRPPAQCPHSPEFCTSSGCI